MKVFSISCVRVRSPSLQHLFKQFSKERRESGNVRVGPLLYTRASHIARTLSAAAKKTEKNKEPFCSKVNFHLALRKEGK